MVTPLSLFHKEGDFLGKGYQLWLCRIGFISVRLFSASSSFLIPPSPPPHLLRLCLSLSFLVVVDPSLMTAAACRHHAPFELHRTQKRPANFIESVVVGAEVVALVPTHTHTHTHAYTHTHIHTLTHSHTRTDNVMAATDENECRAYKSPSPLQSRQEGEKEEKEEEEEEGDERDLKREAGEAGGRIRGWISGGWKENCHPGNIYILKPHMGEMEDGGRRRLKD